MNYLAEVVAYFKTLCMQHPTLLHLDTVGSRVFEVVAYDEAFSDFRTASEEKQYFVRLLLPTISLSNQNNNARKVYQLGLMVAKYYSRREDAQTEKVVAMSAAEHVADDLIAYVMEDARGNTGPFAYMLNHVEELGLTGDFLDTIGDGSYAGVLYMLDLPVWRCIDPNAEDYPERVV